MTLAQLELFSKAARSQQKSHMLEQITVVAAGSRYDERSLSELVKELKS